MNQPLLSLSENRTKVTQLVTLFSLSFSLFACENDPPIPMNIPDAQVEENVQPDAEPMPVVPQSAMEIFKDLPLTPQQILRKPGDAVGNLKAQLPNIKETYSPRFMTEYKKDGPFSTIVYQLDNDLRVIEAVTATFRPAYMHPQQFERVETYMMLRLGEGEKLFKRSKKGRVWRNLDYRIELHIDTQVKDLVVLFHKRGNETLERTRKGLPK
ncbi:MAG: hypothetical protein CMH49_05990 [Myxococcales bacterium]|nr:hypothetical protein [Myxococcales bacterium]